MLGLRYKRLFSFLKAGEEDKNKKGMVCCERGFCQHG